MQYCSVSAETQSSGRGCGRWRVTTYSEGPPRKWGHCSRRRRPQECEIGPLTAPPPTQLRNAEAGGGPVRPGGPASNARFTQCSKGAAFAKVGGSGALSALAQEEAATGQGRPAWPRCGRHSCGIGTLVSSWILWQGSAARALPAAASPQAASRPRGPKSRTTADHCRSGRLRARVAKGALSTAPPRPRELWGQPQAARNGRLTACWSGRVRRNGARFQQYRRPPLSSRPS